MTTFEQNLTSSTKDKYVYTLQNSNSTPELIPNRNVYILVPRDMHKSVLKSITHNSLKYEKLKLL